MVAYSAHRIVEGRKLANMTQQSLADALTKHCGKQILVSQLQGWEGGVKPGPDYLIAIAQVLGKKLEWFYV